MHFETKTLRSKIGRRIFLFFVASALVPIIVFFLLSLNQVNGLLNDKVIQQLHAESKNYGMLLYDRLLFLETEITELTATLDREPSELSKLNTQSNKRFHKFDIASLNADQITLPDFGEKFSLDSYHINHLTQDKTILLNLSVANNSPQIFMISAIDWHGQEPKVLVGEINLDYLWGDEGLLEPTITLCVLDQRNEPIYCANQQTPWVSSSLQSKLTGPSSGNFFWSINDKKSVVNYWSIFLEPRFLTPYWTIITMQPAAEAWSSITNFLHIYSIVFVLAILSVAFLSIHTIRKSMLPLEELMSGIKRIGDGDFSKQVAVQSHDEFETLAISFNQMSSQLSKQITTLRTMAEIDQFILTRLTIEDMLEISLNRIQELVPCDMVGMVMIEDEKSYKAQLHTLSDKSPASGSTISVKIISHEAEKLISSSHLLLRIDKMLPSYLIPMSSMGGRSFIVLPLLVDKKLSAVICLGYRNFADIPDTDIALSREFADRIAVGLSKASWEDQLYYQAHYDVLTHLPNRLLVHDRLIQALSRAKRYATNTAVLFIDVDRFKTVNDSLGHKAGDMLLMELAQRMLQAIRQSDTVARMGGDEFIVVIPDINGNEESLATAITVSEKILAQLAMPFDVISYTIRVSASIGIAIYPRDGDNIEDLLKNADSALYHAKAKGRNNYQFYAKELNETATARLKMENQLHQALERSEFELYYQPKIDILSNKIVGAEALLRWRHPTEGSVSPVRFIPVAEESGLILSIGEWVLRNACKHIKALQEQGFALDVAVNISALQFRQPNLVAIIRHALESARLEPQYLEIEVTESATMQDLDESLALLTQMREMGLRIAIDDFGTGHSSLLYLKRFPIHTLKIDRSFVMNLGTSSQDSAIINSIIVLAKNLGLEVVAEGVETTEQLEYLRQQRCERFQGYLCSPPLPLDEFTALLTKHQNCAVVLEG